MIYWVGEVFYVFFHILIRYCLVTSDLKCSAWAESAYKHGPHVEEETPKKYLHKSSKPMAALHKIVLDPKGLDNLHFYIQFQWDFLSYLKP